MKMGLSACSEEKEEDIIFQNFLMFLSVLLAKIAITKTM
jgi:hypothetical protein